MPSATARTALSPVRARRAAVTGVVLAGLLALTACGAGGDEQAPADGALRVSASPAVPSEPPAQAAAPDRARPGVALPVKALAQRLRPDVLVTGKTSFDTGAVRRLAALAPPGAAVAFRSGTVRIGGKDVRVAGVDPSAFRAFAAEGTAEATAVWQAVARGEAVVGHDAAKALGLALGKPVDVQPLTGEPATLRLGALATTGVPGTDLVVDDETGRRLGLPTATGLLLSAPKGVDPVALAGKARAITGAGGEVDLLTPPTANPVAFLTGSKAAKAFGAFSYRYFPDGTIQPDASWVRANIRSETVPIMGRVTCHRLMLPQLRGALQEVVDAGLSSSLKTFDGCYVPRFIERNPENSISLHTWGIAIDMDASTNYRGIRGTMNPEVVKIFKRWGFRWGGDWTYTDPMHFELAALLSSPQD